jgi:mono/diheme cytochrome c family protein
MIITGFLLWNPIATTEILPGDFIPAAKEAHSGEALLAVLAVIVWHMYHVHIRSFNKSMFTGYLPRHEMEEEHPLELEQIDAGASLGITDEKELARRSSLYFPAAIMVSAILLIGIYFFTTFESTAITTIQPIEEPTIFSPVETTAPSPTTSTIPVTTTTEPGSDTTEPAGAVVAWEGTIDGFFDPACTMCHGSSGGLDLSSYDAAVAGGESGPGVVPGDPDGSVIVQIMEAGGHPAVLDADQLATLRDWISAGSPEVPGDAGATPPAAVGDSWDGGIAEVFAAACGMCHGSSGGLDLSSYDAAVAGGESGPGVVPGDPDGSVIVQIMEAGGHPGMLDDVELERVRAWILAGAPEAGGSEPSGPADEDDGPPPTTDASWDADIAAFFDPNCTACHGSDLQSSGLDLSSYAAAAQGGNAGPGIVPGDAEASSIYSVMQRALSGGAHPQVITDEQLEILRIWIEAGAP